MTLMQFVEVFTLVENVPDQEKRQTHPDSLQQIESMGEIATLPLTALLSVHLLARDLYALTAGASVKTRDTGEEYTASWELPADFHSHLEELKADAPEALAVICRLVARCVYLATDLPLAKLEPEDPEAPKEPHGLAGLVKEMDIVEELEALCEGKGDLLCILQQPVPGDLKCWSDWKEGHVIAAFKEYSSVWSQIRGVLLVPRRSLGLTTDPAVAGGMAKAWGSEWQPPTFGNAPPPKATRMSAVNEEEALDSDSDDDDLRDWEVISGARTPEGEEAQEAQAHTAASFGGSGSLQVGQDVPEAELQGSDFVRDVLQRFMDSRREGQHARVLICNQVAETLALAWEDDRGMAEVLAPLLVVPSDSSEHVIQRLVIEFRENFAKQQDSVPRHFGLQSELSQLQRCILSAKKWALRRSPSDGHCQFHSIGFAVKEDHQQVRQNAVQWIKDHKEECQAFILQEDDTVNKEKAFEDFLQGIAGLDWGNNLTLYALAHYYQREICVLTDNVKKPWLRIEPKFGNPIHVVFYAELHYDAVQIGAWT